MTVEVYRLLHGYNAHNAHAARQIRSHELHVFERVFVKAACDLRVSLDLLLVADHHLHDARHPAGHGVVLNAVVGTCVYDHNALVSELPQKLPRQLRTLSALFRDLLKRQTVPHLTGECDLRLLVCYHLGQYAVFRIGRHIWYAGVRFKRDLVCKRKYFGSECHDIAPSCTLFTSCMNTSASRISHFKNLSI